MEKVVTAIDSSGKVISTFPGSGEYNDAPPNWEEVSAKEVAVHLTWCIEFIESRQIIRIGKKKVEMIDARLFWRADKSGWAMAATREGGLRYFTFALCYHNKTKATNLGRCYNKYTCSDCGYSWEVDSGD